MTYPSFISIHHLATPVSHVQGAVLMLIKSGVLGIAKLALTAIISVVSVALFLVSLFFYLPLSLQLHTRTRVCSLQVPCNVFIMSHLNML